VAASGYKRSVATYAVGDIQGCMSSLERLLALIDYQPARDSLWLVGDLVNRGPRSLDVLRWASRQDSAVVVLGNHDLHLLRRVAGVAGAKKRDTLDDVLAAPDRDRLVDWLRRQALVHVTADHVMVHGGLHPRWTAAKARALAAEIEDGLQGAGWKRWVGELEGEPPLWREELAGSARANAVLAYLVRARTLWADGSINAGFDGAPDEAPPGAVPWFAMPDPAWADHVAVFGHWAALGLDIGPRHLGLDSGCVWGKSLTAVRLDDRAVFQVKAVESAT
jgi:bis(5'-nucleosyl)-tetraphosphatase (symmetrical)